MWQNFATVQEQTNKYFQNKAFSWAFILPSSKAALTHSSYMIPPEVRFSLQITVTACGRRLDQTIQDIFERTRVSLSVV